MYTAQDNVYDNPPEYAGLSPQVWNDHATIPSPIAATTFSPTTSSVITQDEFKKVASENAHFNHRVTELGNIFFPRSPLQMLLRCNPHHLRPQLPALPLPLLQHKLFYKHLVTWS